MKKLIILFLILLVACQKPPTKTKAFAIVGVGTVAGDGTGDPLRTAFQKQNANWLAQQDTNSQVRDSLATIYTEAQTRAKIHDSIQGRITNGLDFDTYLASYLADFTGTGALIGMYELKGVVATTSGFPDNGDSLIINSGFINHPHIEVYRQELAGLQWYNEGLTNNTGSRDSCYVFNSTTGTIIVRPAFSAGERVFVHAFDPIVWHSLTPEGGSGGGGGSGASILLTGIMGYWALNETSGTSVVDATGNSNGTTNATVNALGKIGRAETFNGTDDVIQVPLVAGNTIAGDTISVSCWVYLTSLPGTEAHEAYLIRSLQVVSPWEGVHLTVGTDNRVHWSVRNTGGTEFTVQSSGTLSINTWYHIVGTCKNGETLKLYLNGSDVSTSAGTFSGSLLVNTNDWMIGDSFDGGGSGVVGTMDEVHISHRKFTATQVTSLYNSGSGWAYPFN